MKLKNWFISHKIIIFTGVFIGIAATILQKLGNPANMGICVACFERDIAGALRFHRAAGSAIYQTGDYRFCTGFPDCCSGLQRI